MALEDALKVLEQGKGTKFDAEIVDIFIKQKLYEIERRRFPRFDIKIPFDYQIQTETNQLNGIPQKGFSITISADSLVFVSPKPLPNGTLLNMMVHFTNNKSSELTGKVTREEKRLPQGHYHIGVEFVNLVDEKQQALNELLAEMVRGTRKAS